MIDEDKLFGPEGDDGITVQQLVVGLETFRIDYKQYLDTVIEERETGIDKILKSGHFTLDQQVILYNEGLKIANLARKLAALNLILSQLTKTWEKETGTTITVEDTMFDTLKKYVDNKMVVSLQPAEDVDND